MPTEESEKPVEYVPHEREVVSACVELWKQDSKTEALSIPKLHALIKAANPTWSLSANRVKTCLKTFNMLPQTAEQKQQQAREQQYANQIKSTEMPGLDLTALTKTDLVKVVTTKARGKGFYAVRDIPKGTVLWEEQPMVLVMRLEALKLARQSAACAYCGEVLIKSDTQRGPAGSASCTVATCAARYCNTKCRTKDTIHPYMWHTTGTGKIKKADWIKFENFCIENDWLGAYAFGIVVLTCLKQESTTPVGKPALLRLQYESLATVGQDVRHLSAEKGSVKTTSIFGAEQTEEMWRQGHQFLAATVAKVRELTYRQFLDGVGTFNLNNVNAAVFRLQSHLNHSCEPSVHANFRKERINGLEIVTTADIKANEELKITYVDPKASLEDRQTELRKNWGFICVCPRCKREQKELESNVN